MLAGKLLKGVVRRTSEYSRSRLREPKVAHRTFAATTFATEMTLICSGVARTSCCIIMFTSLIVGYSQAQLVKLYREEKAAQPAWQGEKYVSPLLPHTGSMSVSVQRQLKLHAAVRFTLKGSKLLQKNMA